MPAFDTRRTIVQSATWLRASAVLGVLAYATALAVSSSPADAWSSATWLLIAGLAIATIVSLTRWPKTERARWVLGAVDVVATNVALTLLLSELTLRFYSATLGGNPLIHDRIDAYRFQPSRDYGRLWTNRYGYASREFEFEPNPGSIRLALLGDSFAVGSVRQDVNFASWMEKLRPDLEVYNFGVSAIGPEDYATILRTEALRFHPDVVLVAFFVGNDPIGAPRPQAGLSNHVLPIFVKRVWRLAREWHRLRQESAPPLALPQLAHPAAPQEGFNLSRETYLQIEVERLVVIRRSRQAAMERGWRESFRHLRAMRDSSTQQHARYGIVVIPDEYQANPVLLDQVADLGGVPADDLDLDLPQRRMREFCRVEAIPCLDLAPVLFGTSDTYLPQDTHWNEKGNRIVAEQIVAWLAESGLAPK